MEFLGIKDSIDEFKYSYGFSEKAKSAAKIFGIATANTAIFAGKVLAGVAEKTAERKKQLEKQKNSR